jgi:Cytotoxic
MKKPSGNPARLPYVPAPEALPGFPEARRTMPKGRRRRWVDSRGRIYEWDYQHGRVEVYDRRGRHLGEFDPASGQRLQGPDRSRRVDP